MLKEFTSIKALFTDLFKGQINGDIKLVPLVESHSNLVFYKSACAAEVPMIGMKNIPILTYLPDVELFNK